MAHFRTSQPAAGLHCVPCPVFVHCAGENGGDALLARGLLDRLHYRPRLREGSRDSPVRARCNLVSIAFSPLWTFT